MTPLEAKREVEWWDRNRPAVEAHAKGKRVQYRTSAGTWEVRDSPNFARSYEWRPLPEPALRPYTDEELRGMVGKVFVDKSCGSVQLANCYNNSELQLADEGYLSAGELLRTCTHIDGSPCGVMEWS